MHGVSQQHVSLPALVDATSRDSFDDYRQAIEEDFSNSNDKLRSINTHQRKANRYLMNKIDRQNESKLSRKFAS